jgi:hypothetical protein
MRHLRRAHVHQRVLAGLRHRRQVCHLRLGPWRAQCLRRLHLGQHQVRHAQRLGAVGQQRRGGVQRLLRFGGVAALQQQARAAHQRFGLEAGAGLLACKRQCAQQCSVCLGVATRTRERQAQHQQRQRFGVRHAGPALQAAPGHDLGLGDAAQGLQHHRQIVLHRDAAAVVGVAREQLGQGVVCGLHLPAKPVDLPFKTQQRGQPGRFVAQLCQQGPGAGDIGLAHGQLDEHGDGVDLVVRRQCRQQLAQARGMVLRARDVAGEDAVVHQRGQGAAFDLVALFRVGHGAKLRQHGAQRHLATRQVFEEIAGCQLQACTQGLRRVK